MPSTSLVGRVAWGAALAASAAAFLAAFGTIAFAGSLLDRAEDRRLEEAAVTFAAELDHDARDEAGVVAVHRDESDEMGHTGMMFAVYDGAGKRLVGDARLELPAELGCVDVQGSSLHVCVVRTHKGLSALAGASRPTVLPILAGAAILATLLAATLAWIASRPISRLVVAPLTRLRERIARLDADALAQADLGESEHVAEVDALRSTIAQLIVRVERALAQAQRFAANAAHELRTPLTSLRAELELLAETVPDHAGGADASRAHRKLVELETLVERLLILSIPAHAASELREVASLRDLLEDLASTLPEADRARLVLSDEDATVHGDAALLSTMISNALSNGLKFGTQVSTRIEVQGAHIVLEIDDDGPGVPEAERERVFEPFFRADGALKRRVPGHGLGLPLVRHIARTHGGGAELGDSYAGGACLRIKLRCPGA